MNSKKILLVKKISALEYYYNGHHKSRIIKESDRNHNREVQKIEKILRDAGESVDIVTRKELSEELVKKYDMVISAGGDGTVIAVAAYNPDVPQLNLKTDSRSIGALCQKNTEDALAAFISGKYEIKEWQRQDIYLDGKFIGRASNETCVGERLRFDKLAKYSLFFLDTKSGLIQQEIQSSSGIVIVTGTGSTAWPAAFKPYPRNSPYFEFKTLLIHSGKIEQGRADYLKLNYKGHEGKFSIDTKEYDFPRDSELEIKLSKKPLRVVIPG